MTKKIAIISLNFLCLFSVLYLPLLSNYLKHYLFTFSLIYNCLVKYLICVYICPSIMHLEAQCSIINPNFLLKMCHLYLKFHKTQYGIEKLIIFAKICHFYLRFIFPKFEYSLNKGFHLSNFMN